MSRIKTKPSRDPAPRHGASHPGKLFAAGKHTSSSTMNGPTVVPPGPPSPEELERRRREAERQRQKTEYTRERAKILRR